jgi:putative DNA primase/helicase
MSDEPRHFCDEALLEAGAEPAAEPGEALISELARMSELAYQKRRAESAERLGIRVGILDKLVKAERSDASDKQGRPIELPEPEPWPQPVNGAALLDAIADAIGKHLVMLDYARYACALWVIHTYLIDVFLVTPRLAICSPTKRCGKTTLLDVLFHLVCKPLATGSITTAALFRVVEKYRPALLVDEADTFLGDNQELRGVLNHGHRRTGHVTRTVGDDHEPRQFSVYSPLAIALIGKLPDALQDRAVAIDLKRRLPSEPIERFRLDRTGHLDEIARKTARWAKDNAQAVASAEPEIPADIFNREGDNWRVLLSIADVAGGRWPELARQAADKGRDAEGDQSRIALLLGDIRAIFAERKTDRLASAELAGQLADLEGRPWAEFRAGKPISANQLARLLRPVAIAPDTLRIDGLLAKGYELHQFADAFKRYLASQGDFEPLHRNKCDEIRGSEHFQTVTSSSNVTVSKSKKPNNDGHCYEVTIHKSSGANGPAICGQRCNHCGGMERLADPLRRWNWQGWSDGVLLHQRCEEAWHDRASTAARPAAAGTISIERA